MAVGVLDFAKFTILAQTSFVRVALALHTVNAKKVAGRPDFCRLFRFSTLLVEV